MVHESSDYKPETAAVTALKVAVWVAVFGLMVLAIESPKLLVPSDEPAAHVTGNGNAADNPPRPAAEAAGNDMTASAKVRELYTPASQDSPRPTESAPTF